MRRIVVVSNRVAPADPKASAGGLAVALDGMLRQSKGLWMGWSGEVCDGASPPTTLVESRGVTYATIDIPAADFELYYNGYANRTLWPVFHYRVDLATFERRHYAGYARVNDLFAERLAGLLRPDDLVWVHDYHLIPLAELLRARGVTNRIGFFLHIPFPARQILATIYNHRRLVRSLLAYDLVGLQTDEDLAALADYVRVELGGEVGPDGSLGAYGARTRAAAFPIGLDCEEMARLAASPMAARQAERLRRSLGENALVLGVDRLDYSKGLPEKLRAVERFFERFPGRRGHVTFMQIAPPTRAAVAEYAEIRAELETATGHINGRFAEFDWMPVRYISKAYARRALAGLYRMSAAALVTPLRDGMNLVAKEFVAAQDPDDPGVLVLSRFAGAAEELRDALIVNPYDKDDVAEAMERALAMPRAERRRRWRRSMATLERNDLTAWRERFLASLNALVPAD